MHTVLNKVNGTYVDINFFLGKLRDLLVSLFAILLFFASILALHLLELFTSIAYSNSYLQFFNHPIFQQFFTILVSLIIMLILMY